MLYPWKLILCFQFGQANVNVQKQRICKQRQFPGWKKLEMLLQIKNQKNLCQINENDSTNLYFH